MQTDLRKTVVARNGALLVTLYQGNAELRSIILRPRNGTLVDEQKRTYPDAVLEKILDPQCLTAPA